MAGAVNGIFGNDKAEAMYPSASTDSDGVIRSTARTTTSTAMRPKQLPPVNAFCVAR